MPNIRHVFPFQREVIFPVKANESRTTWIEKADVPGKLRISVPPGELSKVRNLHNSFTHLPSNLHAIQVVLCVNL